MPTPIVTYTVIVDSVTNIVQNGFSLKRLHVKYKFYKPWGSGGEMTESIAIDERIGCSKFLFNFYNIRYVTDDDYYYANLCYSDSAFGVKQFTEVSCDNTGYVGIREGLYQNHNLKIYPNPTNDIITISTEDELINGESFVSIKDLCGREIKQATINNLNSDPGKIDISDLAKGVYILNLSNNNEVVYTGKLVKSD